MLPNVRVQRVVGAELEADLGGDVDDFRVVEPEVVQLIGDELVAANRTR